MTTPKIKVEHLCKSFETKQVLKDVNLEINDKESLVILGGSGSGKSVLIKSITTLMDADSGRVLIDGTDILSLNDSEKSEIMNKFGFLFQGGALFDSMKVWENVAFRLINAENIHKEDAKAIAIDKLKVVGLNESVADLYPVELSGGMQKRVSLARAICADPEIIFFDEPTTGLDPIMSDVINNLIIKSSKSVGATTITITHDMQSARKIADKIALLYEGMIIWQGTVEEMDETDNPYVNQFIHGRAEGPIKFM